MTSLSHSVIRHVLDEVERPCVQKITGEAKTERKASLRSCPSNDAVTDALANGCTLVGGSAWLWARQDMRASVDVLVIDEAGQFSLANAVAIAPAATSLVLLGDPQQLTQPTQATRPFGAGVSALEHLIGAHDTVPADRGIFLGTTWRMPRRLPPSSPNSPTTAVSRQHPDASCSACRAKGCYLGRACAGFRSRTRAAKRIATRRLLSSLTSSRTC